MYILYTINIKVNKKYIIDAIKNRAEVKGKRRMGSVTIMYFLNAFCDKQAIKSVRTHVQVSISFEAQ